MGGAPTAALVISDGGLAGKGGAGGVCGRGGLTSIGGGGNGGLDFLKVDLGPLLLLGQLLQSLISIITPVAPTIFVFTMEKIFMR